MLTPHGAERNVRRLLAAVECERPLAEDEISLFVQDWIELMPELTDGQLDEAVTVWLATPFPAWPIAGQLLRVARSGWTVGVAIEVFDVLLAAGATPIAVHADPAQREASAGVYAHVLSTCPDITAAEGPLAAAMHASVFRWWPHPGALRVTAPLARRFLEGAASA